MARCIHAAMRRNRAVIKRLEAEWRESVNRHQAERQAAAHRQRVAMWASQHTVSGVISNFDELRKAFAKKAGV